MHTSEIKKGEAVRHANTNMRGKIEGSIIENGTLKHIVTWANGRKSHVTADSLEPLIEYS